MNKDKVLIDRTILESLMKTFSEVKEYLERNDTDFYALTENAIKALKKALRYFNSKNPDLHCDPDEVSISIETFLPGNSPAMVTDIIGENDIKVENDDGDTILKINAPQSVSELRHVLMLMSDPSNYYYKTLNPEYFNDYNFIEIYDDWKNEDILPSEFENAVDILIDDQQVILSDKPLDSSAQLIAYQGVDSMDEAKSKSNDPDTMNWFSDEGGIDPRTAVRWNNSYPYSSRDLKKEDIDIEIEPKKKARDQ